MTYSVSSSRNPTIEDAFRGGTIVPRERLFQHRNCKTNGGDATIISSLRINTMSKNCVIPIICWTAIVQGIKPDISNQVGMYFLLLYRFFQETTSSSVSALIRAKLLVQPEMITGYVLSAAIDYITKHTNQ